MKLMEYIVCTACGEAVDQNRWKADVYGFKCPVCKKPVCASMLIRVSEPNPWHKKRRWGSFVDGMTEYRHSLHAKKKSFHKLPARQRVAGYWSMIGDWIYVSCPGCGHINVLHVTDVPSVKHGIDCIVCHNTKFCSLHFFPILEDFRLPKKYTRALS